MSTTIAPTIQLPEGYVANERIGSGGYGEVWRATAPGGVEKAVKVVFGHCGEELAERELKSMERIRSVRHPFVISLERFEVVAGRLVIVTELADMSLDACFRNYQESGKPGIPREELIAYVRDAAEALDCLVERHSLQHLDIKPENLLVVGEHVKVGDFGLVKELATRSMNSLMGGMTPLYSAPEVFDDMPSPRSDQYSLAIVYQQMLTGQVPFPGRTPAQLAKQHTQAEPILHALNEDDRQVVRKALSKRPEDRFVNCREFVAALAADASQGRSSPNMHTGRESQSPASKQEDETKTHSALLTQPIPASPKPVTEVRSQLTPSVVDFPARKPLCYPKIEEAVEEISLPPLDIEGATTMPTLVVGIGGLGTRMLSACRSKLVNSEDCDTTEPQVAWLAIDTDREALKSVSQQTSGYEFQADEILHIPLKRAKEYGDESRQMLNWVSRRWLYNIPRSLETRGYRPLGRIAAVDHAESLLRVLYSQLYQLTDKNPATKQVRVVLLASTSGGTGSGIVVDVGQAVRSLAKDLSLEMRVDAMLAMPERSAGVADSLPIANAYSLITELAHTQEYGNLGPIAAHGPAARFESSAGPFDCVDWLAIPPQHRGDRNRTFDSIAERLLLETTQPAASTAFVASSRLGGDQVFQFQSFACTSIDAETASESLLDSQELPINIGGFQRVRLFLGPGESPSLRALREHFPRLITLAIETDQQFLVTLAVGINPLHLGAKLAEFYPDIAEAASRLHAREDVNWQDLRCFASSDGEDSGPTDSPAANEDQQTIARAANT